MGSQNPQDPAQIGYHPPMPETAGHMTATEFADKGAVIKVTAHKLHEHESKLLIDEVHAYLENSGVNLVAMDYSAVEFISSAALGAMVTISKDVKARNKGRFVITGLNDDATKVMKLTRLDRLIDIKPDMTKAQKFLLK